MAVVSGKLVFTKWTTRTKGPVLKLYCVGQGWRRKTGTFGRNRNHDNAKKTIWATLKSWVAQEI